MLSKSLILFSVDGWSCVPSLLFTWCQTMVQVMKIIATSFKGFHAGRATLNAPSPAAGHRRPMPQPETPGHSGTSGSVSRGVTAPFFWVLVHKVLFEPPRVYFPVLCRFWQLCGGVSGDLLQAGLCHILVCGSQRPCPCSSPLRPVPPQETLRHSSVSISMWSLGPGVHVCLSPLSVPGRKGV